VTRTPVVFYTLRYSNCFYCFQVVARAPDLRWASKTFSHAGMKGYGTLILEWVEVVAVDDAMPSNRAIGRGYLEIHATPVDVLQCMKALKAPDGLPNAAISDESYWHRHRRPVPRSTCCMSSPDSPPAPPSDWNCRRPRRPSHRWLSCRSSMAPLPFFLHFLI
jgi:hypothetical protein